MSKKGVSKISGNPSPKVGEAVTYTVTDWYPSTPQNQRNPANVIWELFKKRSNGRFTTTNIKKTGVGNFTFGEVAQKHTYRLEAYLFEPEGEGASTIEINPQPEVVPKIEKVELQYVDDSPGMVFSFTEKMRARAQCVNLNGKKLKFTLWEDDATGEGHDAKNLLIETKEATVDRTGVATVEFMLTRTLMQKAMQGETDPKQLEFYVTVEYFSHNKHATDNVNVNNPLHTPTPTPQSRPQQPANNPSTPPQSTPETSSNNAQPRAENSPAAEKPASQMEERQVAGQSPNPSEELHDYQEAQGTIQADQPPTPQSNEGKTVSIVEDSSVEELLDAYFAKKEYTKQTGEAAGTLEYQFGSNGNKTATDAEKEKIAKIIFGKPAVKALTDKKEYTTLEAIKQALSKEVYNKDEKVSFQTFKLGGELKKITSAPLDTKLYLVAKTAGSGLSDKQATIIIKEKDGLIKGFADAVLPILEISEEQMEQATPTTGVVPGTEKSEFTGKIENGMVKIPVHLRPKSDDELKQWREKLRKGKQDGEYTYTFNNVNGTAITAENKKSLSATIAKNAKEGKLGNPKIENGKVAYAEDIETVLQIKTYTKGETIKFNLYKKEKELLYLNVKAQGEKQHDKEFLKADGAYFEVGKKCDCEARIRAFIRMVRVGEGTGEVIKSRDKEKNIIYIPHDFQKGYTTAFGGNTITDLSTHPQTIYKVNEDDEGSSAAGAYQVMRYTWWELAGFEVVKKKKTGNYFENRDLLKKYKIPDYSAESQDKICIALMKKQRPNLIDKIIANNIREAIQQDACFIWASLPETETESHYSYNGKKQPATPLDTCLEHYNTFLAEELKGSSNLHLKAGFLKDFNIICCTESDSNGVCPDDQSQCFEYADVVSSPKLNDQSDNVNKNRWHRTKRYNSSHPQGYYHTGTDVLASSGTIIKSMLCGTVHTLVDTFSANEYRANSLGNYIVIKSKDKNGNEVYIKYCHLDEVSVTKDQKVKHGDTIGKSGSTGNAASVYENGVLIHGIKPIYRHIHIEAATSANFGNTRIDPEQFMKTKFDETTKGNPI